MQHFEEMEKLLNDHMKNGDYQFVLEKACELDKIDLVTQILKISREIGLPKLNIFEPLKVARNVEIIQLLIKRDLENEKYYGQTPNILWSYLFNYQPIPYTNDPLTTDQLKEIITHAKKDVNQSIIIDELEKYYKRMYEYKRASEINVAYHES
jgi:hypothetical protein